MLGAAVGIETVLMGDLEDDWLSLLSKFIVKQIIYILMKLLFIWSLCGRGCKAVNDSVQIQ